MIVKKGDALTASEFALVRKKWQTEHQQVISIWSVRALWAKPWVASHRLDFHQLEELCAASATPHGTCTFELESAKTKKTGVTTSLYDLLTSSVNPTGLSHLSPPVRQYPGLHTHFPSRQVTPPRDVEQLVNEHLPPVSSPPGHSSSEADPDPDPAEDEPEEDVPDEGVPDEDPDPDPAEEEPEEGVPDEDPDPDPAEEEPDPEDGTLSDFSLNFAVLPWIRHKPLFVTVGWSSVNL